MSIPIGGPGTVLPFWLESFCSWIFAVSCLGVALYYWARQMISGYFAFLGESQYVVPLMTHSRYELLNVSGLKRYQQLLQYLQIRYPKAKAIEEWTDDDWILRIRSDLTTRRLVSLVMLQRNDLPLSLKHDSVVECFSRVWSRVLVLPDVEDDHPYRISVVTAAYKEDGIELLTKLQHAMDVATKPKEIQWILVDAGHSSQLEVVKSKLPFVQLVKGSGGGRGPSLNQGGAVAQGRILVFLHADTRLPPGWDVAIQDAFEKPSPRGQQAATTTSAAAFSFAIDTTAQGLQGGPFPPGIKAIEMTANWRTQLFSLPYGDQCLSIPKVFFDYLGGFPHQCLMEDYELISLLRHRRMACRERLVILPLSAYCGPRRWQAFGVLYVTYTNSRCVGLYTNGVLTPDQLYEIYYGAAVPGGTPPYRSPWEVELELLLSRKYVTR
jgi:glycosyltransferase involved in cell wall biosynthesis